MCTEDPAGTPGTDSLERVIEELPLVDHHAHGALLRDPSRREFEELITESNRPVPAWMTQFDSQTGFAILRHCAPVLDLDPSPSPEAYLARRAELGTDEVNRRLLAASGIGHFLVETGYRGEEILDPAAMAGLTGRPTDEIVRLESVAETLAAEDVTAERFAGRYAEALEERTRTAVGVKTIVAYRYGLDLDPEPPSPAEVTAAAGCWLRAVESTGAARVDDPVLLRHLIWAGVERGLPLQFHVGYGDPDVDLVRCDPLRLRGLIEAVEPYEVPILLPHCYPFHRNAGYLAQVYPHVYFDVGLSVNYTGARCAAVVAESLELAPFAKILFSSDAWGPAELHHLGALLWRRATTRVLRGFVDADEWTEAQAVRVAAMIGVRNARRVYRMEGA